MKVPIIEELLKGPLPPGSSILVEYDPTSAWYQASLSMAVGWLKEDGVVTYNVAAQPPDNIRSLVAQLGIDVNHLEAEDRFRVFDWYTATLGRKSNERLAFYSLKAADLSVLYSKYLMATETKVELIPPQPTPEWLRILDDASCLGRFNEERSWVEFVRTRFIPIASLWKSTGIIGVISGIHSEWTYKNLEAASDGVIDIKQEEHAGETKSLLRIRSLRNVGFDSRWHELKIGENLAVSVEKMAT